MFKLTRGKTALISGDVEPETDTFNVIVPVRPPFKLGDIRFELALRGEKLAVEFGEGELLGTLRLLARDKSGTIVPPDLDARFPGDYEQDPDYQLLLRYVLLAVEEAFCSDSTSFLEAARPWTFDNFCFECPAVLDVETCMDFPVEKFRFWAAGTDWDGITRVKDALASRHLPQDALARFEPRLRGELRLRAVAHCLLPIPEHKWLVALARSFYEERAVSL